MLQAASGEDMVINEALKGDLLDCISLICHLTFLIKGFGFFSPENPLLSFRLG